MSRAAPASASGGVQQRRAVCVGPARPRRPAGGGGGSPGSAVRATSVVSVETWLRDISIGTLQNRLFKFRYSGLTLLRAQPHPQVFPAAPAGVHTGPSGVSRRRRRRL